MQSENLSMPMAPWYRAEISRKVLHVSSVLIPLIYVFVQRGLMLWLLTAGLAIAAVVEVLRYAHPGFRTLFRDQLGFMVRSVEWHRLTGSTYVLLGALLAVALFPKPIAIVVLIILSISDSAASLVGLNFGRTRFLGKSLAGSLAFFFTALAILWPAEPISHGVAFLAAAVATLAEALPALKLGPVELNDNLLVPLSTGFVIWILTQHTAAPEIAAALSTAW